jgi:hypothetical protein
MLKKEYSYPLLPLWGVVACCRVKFVLTLLSRLGHAAGGVVVEALRYKQEGRGFDSRLCHWNLSLI